MLCISLNKQESRALYSSHYGIPGVVVVVVTFLFTLKGFCSVSYLLQKPISHNHPSLAFREVSVSL